MSLGNHLFQSRKRAGLTQEEVAFKLGVSRQTISKWELDETVPDIYQVKKLAGLYHLSLDDLITFDIELQEIEQTIQDSTVEKEEKVDWTKAWGKKYPILVQYQKQVNIEKYASQIREMLMQLQKEYGFNSLDSMLVLKDILYHEWKDKKDVMIKNGG